jgi:hypothetical protein
MKDTERLLLDDLFSYVYCVSQDECFKNSEVARDLRMRMGMENDDENPLVR